MLEGGVSSEVIIHILHYCEYLTILRFASTCKAYYELVNQSTSLQLHIELEVNGLELVKGTFTPGATYSEILEDLRQFRDAWLSLSFGCPIVRPLGKSDMLLWELREGFYLKAFSQSRGDRADAIQFIPLDANSPDPPPVIFSSTFDEFTADPAQGLVAIMSQEGGTLAQIHVQLCSSATGSAHPLARYPKLTAELDSSFRLFPSESAIEIMGDLVLIRISDVAAYAYEVLIWNWKSGIFLTRISSREGICDQFFLDRQHLILQTAAKSSHQHLDTLALLVYVVPDADSSLNDFPSGYLKVLDSAVSQPILRLEFPRIKELFRISVDRFLLQSDPVPGRTLYAKSAAFASSYAKTLGMAFSCRPIDEDWGGALYYRVFVDGRFLVDQIRTNTHSSSGTRLMPWASWGIKATRWFLSSLAPNHWVAWMSGPRFITALPEFPYYSVIDFSSPTTHRFRERSNKPQPGSGGHKMVVKWLESDIDYLANDTIHGSTSITIGVDNPHIIGYNDDIAFDELIVSRLPYRLAINGLTKTRHEALQILGDCVVGVSTWGPASENIIIYKLGTDSGLSPERL